MPVHRFVPRIFPGIGLLAAPARIAGSVAGVAAGLAVEALGGPPKRRTSSQGTRHWIEVRGLGTDHAPRIGDAVLAALEATPGVRTATLNRAVARVVVTVESDGPTAGGLSGIIADAERRTTAAGRTKPVSLPGDDAVLLARTASAAVASAGLGLALTGSLMRLRAFTNLVSVPPTVLDHVPSLRMRVEERIGADGTDLLFAVMHSTAAALTASPSSAAAEAAKQTMLAAEAWNARRGWLRHEPALAEQPCDIAPREPQSSTGTAEHYANRSGATGLAAAAALGLLSADPRTAGAAALVSAPKALRNTRESFGCALTRGLTDRQGALVVRPRVLRRLDRIDAVVIDPRILYTDELQVSRITGLHNSKRTRAWNAARAALQDGGLSAGWHELTDIPQAGDGGRALISPVRNPLAAAVVAEARRAGHRVVSVRDDGLRSLAQGFDRLEPVGPSVDQALADAVAALKADGAHVALLTTPEMSTGHSADVTVGVLRDDLPAPWGADIFVPDLSGMWRVLHALPVAKAVRNRGIELSASSSLIGALMLIPGVPGSGPDSVNVGAIFGLWSGFTSGNRVFRDPLPSPEPTHDWHTLSVENVRDLLPRPADDSEPVRRRVDAITESPPVRLLHTVTTASWRRTGEFATELRANLSDPITPILATGAAASALLGSPFDAALVGGVLLANAALSAQQQLHAERVLKKLLAVQDPPARRRVGELDVRRHEEVDAVRLRLGDIIEVRAGEVVPADARLISVANVEVDESTLTGESFPVAKDVEPTPGAPLAERTGMIYAGSTVVAGTALAVVTAVGRSTEMRRAMAMAPAKSREIGLHSQLRKITGRALPWSLAGGTLVGLLSAIRRTPLRRSVGDAVSIIVAAVPEGLPLVATLAQLAAARKLSGRSVLIRNPHSIEAFARLRVVCFDKTGTLSVNRMAVRQVRAFNGHSDQEVLHRAALTTFTGDGRRAEQATDVAIFDAADAQGVAPRPEFDAVLPFQSGRPYAASLRGRTITLKGAPEVVGAALGDGYDGLVQQVEELASSGLRVLAVAHRQLEADEAAAAVADAGVFAQLCSTGLEPVGLVGLADPPRANARMLLEDLRRREIGVRLITGDHPLTAGVIARELGLEVTPEQVMTGGEWELLSAEERAAAVTERVVFARMSPEHKIDVVQTLERLGLVTAMVGDGANDAAAIRAASVGVGVASAGSDPARTAADVMLLDGRIEALLDALDEGHQLWRRVQSAVSVLLGGNAGEVAFALITSLLTGRSALNARQMLLVNMLTDALPAAALAVSSQTNGGLADRDEAAMWRAIGIRGTATTVGATLAWLLALTTPGMPRRASTVALIGLVGTQMLQTLTDSRAPLVVATMAGSFATMVAVVSIPGVSQMFGCTPVDPIGWGQGLLAAVLASALAAVAPQLLARGAGMVTDHIDEAAETGGAASVVDDDDHAGAHQNGVEVAQRRGQHSNGAAEQRILSETVQ